MSDDAFAALGRKQLELDNLSSEYARLLQLLQQVVSGTTPADHVAVDLPGRSWKIVKPEYPGATLQSMQ